MADIRINSLPTTASASSSDDFLALDGATNGTRKLNAYSPTFGGNLTVSGGVLTLNNASESYVELKIAGTTKGYLDQLSSTLNVVGMSGVDVDIYAGGSNPANRVAKFAASGIATTLYGNLTVSGTGGVQLNSVANLTWGGSYGAGIPTIAIPSATSIGFYPTGSTSGKTFELFGTGNATLTGNLTVSGTGTSSFAGAVTIANTASTSSYQTGLRLQSSAGSAPNTIQALEFYSSSLSAALGAIDALREAGSFASSLRFYSTTSGGALTERGRFNSSGNLLLKSDGVDSGNGKLQLADHTTSAGGIGFGTDTSLYRTASGALAVYGSGTDSRINFSHSTSTANKGFDVQLDTAKDAYVWQRENRSLFFGTNNTTALTLDSSQRTFTASAAKIGSLTGTVDSRLHVYESTAVSTSNGLTLEQASTGDSLISFLLTGVQRWSVGIDNSDSDSFKIGTGDLGAADKLTITTAGDATFAGTGTSSFAGNLNIKGALGAHQTAALNLAYEGSSVSQLVAYGADASTLGRVNVILRKAGTGTDAVTGLSVRDFGIITQGGVAQTPASASATGTAGTIQWDASYIYVCTATNTWKRVAIATW